MNTTTASRPARSNLWALKPRGELASASRVHASATIATSLPESSSCTYWVRRFAHEDLELALPDIHSENRIAGTAICTPVVEIAADTAERLRALARSELTTPFTLLLAAWQVVLFRHGGRSDFVIGCGTPGGTTTVQQRPLLVHATVSGHANFRTLVRLVATRRAEGATHGNVTIPDLVRAFSETTSPGRHPLFQAAFVQRNALSESATHTADNKFTHPVDIACVWEDNGRTIRIRMEYPAGVIAPDVAARFPAHMANILRAALSLPEAPIATLPMLTAAEYIEKARA